MYTAYDRLYVELDEGMKEMSMQIEVLKGIQQGNEIEFSFDETSPIKSVIPAGKMITDSEKMTFVYLLDDGDVYGHVHFKQDVWPLMVEAVKLDTDPVLIVNKEKIKLPQFVEELTMLIFNIEGNNNYGESFSKAVEETFAEILNE